MNCRMYVLAPGQVVVEDVNLSAPGLALAVLDGMRQQAYARVLAEQYKLDQLLIKVKAQKDILDSVLYEYNQSVLGMTAITERNQHATK